MQVEEQECTRLLYTRTDAAKLLSVSVDTLDRYIDKKEITTRRKGRRILIQHSELVRFSRKDSV